jgi:hypothetical protein
MKGKGKRKRREKRREIPFLFLFCFVSFKKGLHEFGKCIVSVYSIAVIE